MDLTPSALDRGSAEPTPVLLGPGVAARLEALPLGWRASRLDLPFNGGSYELRLDRADTVSAVPLGAVAPAGVVWTRSPVRMAGEAIPSALPPVGGLLVRGLVAAAGRLARGRLAGKAVQAEMSAAAPTLVVTRRPGQGRRIVLGERAGIGRGEDNAVTLGDALASRNHALIQRTDDGYRIKDLGSLYGTLVNGERITGERVLASGDEIVIGVTRLRFEWVGRRPAAPAPSPPAASVGVVEAALTTATPVGVVETPPTTAAPVAPAATCARCHVPVRAGVRFCTACGAPVLGTPEQQAACPRCGRLNRSGVAFCTGCGQRLTAS